MLITILVKTKPNKIELFNQPLKIYIPIKYVFSLEDVSIHTIKNVTVTSYTNSVEETDSTPNITATNRLVYEGSCAVSQDLFKKTIFPGDIIYVKKLNQYFIVEDTMNKRHTNAIDIFVFKHRKYDETYPKKLKTKFKSDIIVISKK